MMQTDADVWTLADEDFRLFLDRMRNHPMMDQPTVDPALRALLVERQLRHAGKELAELDKLHTSLRPSDRLRISAAQCRFVADRLANGEGVDTDDALIWLDAARKVIRYTRGKPVDESPYYT